MKTKKEKIFNITLTAVMASLATIIYMLFPEINIVPVIEYMKIDFSDFPALLAGIVFGPAQGILVEVIKNIIHLTRTTTYGIGEIMNVLVASGMIISMWGFTRLFSKLFKNTSLSPKTYFISAIITVFITIVVGWISNIIFTPIFYSINGWPLSGAVYWAGVWGSTALNTVKAIFNLLPFYPIYLSVEKAFKKSLNI